MIKIKDNANNEFVNGIYFDCLKGNITIKPTSDLLEAKLLKWINNKQLTTYGRGSYQELHVTIGNDINIIKPKQLFLNVNGYWKVVNSDNYTVSYFQ